MSFERINFDLVEVIKNVVELMISQADDKGVRLSYHLEPGTITRLIGDPNRLRQILLNLVSNGVKFTSNGSVSVEVTTITESEDEVELGFSVRDTGIGCPRKSAGSCLGLSRRPMLPQPEVRRHGPGPGYLPEAG